MGAGRHLRPSHNVLTLLPSYTGYDNRLYHWLYLFGRLAPGTTIEEARTALNTVYRPILHDVEAPLQRRLSDRMLEAFRARTITLEPGWRGQSIVHDMARTPLVLLLVVMGLVLLIACANIANMLLARGAGRSMEMAVRLSLGASRRHLLAQLLTESCLLAALGGAASLLVAQWTLEFVASLFPPVLTGVVDVAIRPRTLVFTAVVALGTGILFGLYPALHATRTELLAVIRANATQLAGARGATRFRNALVTAQIALAMALLGSAGLFLGSLVNVFRTDLGMRVENLVAFTISPARNGYDAQRRMNLYKRVEEELAAIPGVTGVAASGLALLNGDTWGTVVAVEGFERGPGSPS